MAFKKPRIIIGGIATILIGLAVLWLQPVHAERTITVPVQPRTVTVPVLTLTLTPHAVTLDAGGTMQIDATMTNAGDGAANAVLLTVSVPVGIRVVSAAGNGNQWNIGTVPAGGKTTMTLAITADQNMKAGDAILNASVTADGVAAVSATSVLTIKQGQVRGATTDGTDTAMTELPQTGTSTALFWIGSALLVTGVAGLYLHRRLRTQGV